MTKINEEVQRKEHVFGRNILRLCVCIHVHLCTRTLGNAYELYRCVKVTQKLNAKTITSRYHVNPITASSLQVFYSLQPVWAATFAALFLGEEVEVVGYVGGAIVLLATYIAGKEKMQKS